MTLLILLNYLFLSTLLGFPECSFSQDSKANASSRESPTVAKEQKEEVFKLLGMGEKKTAAGTHLGFKIYEGTSGTKVVVTHGNLRSPAKAETELQQWLDAAKKIISRDEKKNILGLKVGYRAVATYVDPNTKEDFTAVMWTNGSDLWEVDSSSLPTALDFEKRIEGDEPHNK